MSCDLSPELVNSLQRFDTCAVVNAIERFETRLRNEGFTDSTVRCMFPQLGSMVGYAVPVRVRCSSPPPDGHPYLDRTDWWNYILTIPEPRIVVIEDVDRYAGQGAFVGEVHATVLQALGCVGAVTNGSVRDLPAIERAGFHLFASTLSPSHSYVHIVGFGSAVQVGGVKIRPGELLHGDRHGIVSVPKEIASQLPAAVHRLHAQEQEILELCRSKDFSLQNLRGAVEGNF